MYNFKVIKLNIENTTKFKFTFKNIYERIVKETLMYLNIKEYTELSVIILDNNGIRDISRIYRNKNDSTDILSFPADYKSTFDLIGYNLLGDIYLSFEKIELQAQEFCHSSKREWSYLFTHGLLHLLGYDHKTEKEEREMNSIAYKIMEILKIER